MDHKRDVIHRFNLSNARFVEPPFVVLLKMNVAHGDCHGIHAAFLREFGGFLRVSAFGVFTFAVAHEPDLTLVFVSYDETWAAQKDFLVQMFGVIPPGVVLLRDPKGQGQGTQSVDTLWHRLGATAVPETFIIRDGKILAKAIGGLNWKHPEIRKYLGLVLNKRGNVSCSMTSRPDAGALWILWGLLVLVVFRRVLARQMAH